MSIVVAIETYPGREEIYCYAENGRYIDGQEFGPDLMMADDDYLEKLKWGEYDHIGESTEKVQQEAKRIELGELVKAIERLNDTLIESKEILSKMQSVWEDINRKTENKNYRSSRYLGPCG